MPLVSLAAAPHHRRQTPPDAKPRRRYAPRMAPEKRREQLIDAALSVIVHQGYEGVSIEAIARTAGVTDRSSTTTSPTSASFCMH